MRLKPNGGLFACSKEIRDDQNPCSVDCSKYREDQEGWNVLLARTLFFNETSDDSSMISNFGAVIIT